MEDAVGYARHGRLVATDLELLKCHVEHRVGVGHLFATDDAVAGEVGSRRHELVDHGVGAATTIVVLRHLLTRLVAQPVGGPRLAFGDVVTHGIL